MRTISPRAGRDGSDESPVRLDGFGVGAVCPHVGRVSTEYRTKPFEAGDWIDKLSRPWTRRLANTLPLARLRDQPRRSVKHGQWSYIWRAQPLPFSKRDAEMLVTVRERLGRRNAENSAPLSTTWNALYREALEPKYRDRDYARKPAKLGAPPATDASRCFCFVSYLPSPVLDCSSRSITP